ncbi:MAG: ribosome silencing factor [Spirochaetaceae bacterium]|nr:ribosome silencing factor [Spirochaetaceae bacterium]
MEDMLDKKNKVIKVAEFIDELKGINTVALDLTSYNGWTDYFIITTVSSATHLKGMYNNIQDILNKLSIEPFFRHKKIDNENWVLIDCGYFVIHLMDKEHREFYDLEKLWFKGEVIFSR